MNFKLFVEMTGSEWVAGATVRVVVPVDSQEVAMQMVQSMPEEARASAKVGNVSDAYHSSVMPAVFLYVQDESAGRQVIQGLPRDMQHSATIETRPANQ